LTTAHVIAIYVDERKLKMVEDLRANYVIKAGKGTMRELRRIAAGRLSTVLDFVGSYDTLRLGYESLRRGGRLVVIGAARGSLTFSSGETRGREVVGSILGSLSDMNEIIELAERGKFKVKYSVFDLDEIGTVLEMLKHHEIVGRDVLRP